MRPWWREKTLRWSQTLQTTSSQVRPASLLQLSTLTDSRIHRPCADYFRSEQLPKVLITTCYKTTRVMFDFLTDFMEMLPNAHFYKRRVRG